jgi:putative isomerase
MARSAKMKMPKSILWVNALAIASCTGPAQTLPAPRLAPGSGAALSRSADYEQVQQHLARGWNTWDVHSVATQVLLPDGLAIHVGVKHNSTLNGDAFLADALIGRLDKGSEVVTPGPHSWDGSYTRADFAWNGHKWRIESAHQGGDLVLLMSPLPSEAPAALAPSAVFSVNFLWNRPGTVALEDHVLRARGTGAVISIYCTCEHGAKPDTISVPVGGPYFVADLNAPIGLSTGSRRSLEQIRSAIEMERRSYQKTIAGSGAAGPILDAIETTLGWDTIYDPEKQRVISPVSRVWSVGWGGYVLFDWDTFFAATMAGMGDKDLAYANALEILGEQTRQGFVPNYARAGGWKSSDRSEPPVGAITVLGLYQRFHDRWFLADAFDPLLRWNRWWNEYRQMQGFIVLGSDPGNQPANLDDTSRGTWQGAVYESGLDNSPMYDGTFYNPKTHLLEYADVGMTSLYIADCDALSAIADTLERPAEASEIRDRAARYRAALASLWDRQEGIFLNKDLHTGQFSRRLSPTNFYPLLAKAATAEQARTMIEKHLLNPGEFWGDWVLPNIARDDPAFKDQQYWRGRIWGPVNYLVYLGLCNYQDAGTRRALAAKSYRLFLKEWTEKGHVHENYNAITGEGDDVNSSDRFYHWGALLGYIEFLEQSRL